MVYNQGVNQFRFTPFYMSKDLEISRLCDVYGSLLTEHKLEVVRSYYDYDLSLAEIAENIGVTRQAVLNTLKQAEKQLYSYENKLGIVARYDLLESKLGFVSSIAESDPKQAGQVLNEIVADLRQREI